VWIELPIELKDSDISRQCFRSCFTSWRL